MSVTKEEKKVKIHFFLSALEKECSQTKLGKKNNARRKMKEYKAMRLFHVIIYVHLKLYEHLQNIFHFF